MRIVVKSLCLLGVLPLVFASSLVADDEPERGRLGLAAPDQKFGTECLAIIRDCFAHAGNQRSQCFYNAAYNPFCSGLEAGRLSLKRWAMNPNNTSPVDPAWGLVSPVMIDKECIAQFDNVWSSALIRGDMTSEDVAQLETRLDKCRHSPAHETLRP